jgi:hypothetical protein
MDTTPGNWSRFRTQFGAGSSRLPNAAPVYTDPMRRCFLLFLMIAPLAWAQSTQIGGMIGRGGLARLFESSSYHAVAGVEACVLCGSRLGLFAEYHHWTRTGAGAGEPVGMDLAGGGLRIQGKGERVRPFLDFGLMAGAERKDRIFPLLGRQSEAVAAGTLGFGAAISITEHWYVRPLARIVVLSSLEFGGFGGASVGYRF